MFLEFATIKIVFLYVIFFISILYQVILFGSLIRHRKDVDFLSAIIRNGNISKAGIFFFVLMLIITYQALFLDEITAGLIELMGIIVLGDLGAKYVANKKIIDLEKVKKTRDCDVELSSDEFKNL